MPSYLHKPPSLHKLPFDLWLEIASFSEACDLAAFSTTSSKFLSIIRPLLYRSVCLCLWSYSWRSTMDLLARDKMLASVVVELYLLGPSPEPDMGPHVDLDAITNMTSLKRVRIEGAVWSTELEQLEIGRILSAKTGTSLEQLTYSASRFHEELEWHPHGFGGLGGLRVIEWRCSKYGGDCTHNFPSH